MKMRLGRVLIPGYVVDLNDDDMVEYAKIALYEDIYSAIKYNEVHNYIFVECEAPTLQGSDIAEFLVEGEGEIDIEEVE